jgi:hypothetical protein
MPKGTSTLLKVMSNAVKGCKTPGPSRVPVSLPGNSPGRRLTTLSDVEIQVVIDAFVFPDGPGIVDRIRNFPYLQ